MTEEEARQRVIRSMCPEKVCRTCGEPSRRIIGAVTYPDRRGIVKDAADLPPGRGQWKGQFLERGMRDGNASWGPVRTVETLGFTDCGHDDWREGVWLDPFT